MADKIWKLLQFVAGCLVATLAYIFVPWSELDSGWTQAVGSFAALGVAIYVMTRQNRHAAKLLIQADILAARRRAAGAHAIVTRACLQMRRVDAEIRNAIRTFSDTENLRYELRVMDGIISPMRATICGIPTYELGSFDMAEAVHQLGEALTNLDAMLKRGIDRPDGFEQDASVIAVLDIVLQVVSDSESKFGRGLSELK